MVVTRLWVAQYPISFLFVPSSFHSSIPFCSCKMIAKLQLLFLSSYINIFFLLIFIHSCSSQITCPNCGSMQVPYPLSTNPKCGDSNYSLRCDFHSQKLYFDALNGSSYLVLRIMALSQRLVVQPSAWQVGTCVTQDMVVSEGIRLNQSLPFNITSSNTIFLFNCSPRLLVSPLNCTPSSLCHKYLESSGHVDRKRAVQCANELDPCCTFVAGGMPSAYKIRLHSSGCKAFRSILQLDPEKPANEWEEGLEIQWAPPSEPVCKTQIDCSGASKCSPADANGLFRRCLCDNGYKWDHVLGTCLRKKRNNKTGLTVKVSIGLISFFALSVALAAITVRKSRKLSNKAKLAKAREDLLKSSNGGKSARIFHLKDVKKATNGFSKDRILGSGGFGEVYKGELQDGTVVAVKAAKVGNIKSTQQVLNELGILSQVNHKNLVRLLGCCVEAEQPLMIYDYISNGTLFDHLQGKYSPFLTWETRLRIALQTAEALAYLHSAAYTPIYHRDVKSTNILLDDEFNAKVSDFGLSRLALPGLSHVSTCAQGTLGYLDPEYYRNYQLTDKSDVYSYGVVLHELLTSKKAIDFSREADDVNLTIYVSQRAENGAIMEVMDQKLIGMEPSENILTSAKLFLELAFACVREKKNERPSMNDVVHQLQGIIQIVSQEMVSSEVKAETV
ncbi:LOW QUALITY PROTEIN: wall-associated receptor kinase-like 20 [Pistacia vera]|uniref:LOW QUALITY PROTEIN: wall-associated receptor kinase-like 20 n=1 Tax=Pistacia vera TaxID=55513 RepID=UPI0012631DED|nr:LOW QUALITY PROTEIN: wall-associated receptor kinase-like 20 [Pistacia vera]